MHSYTQIIAPLGVGIVYAGESLTEWFVTDVSSFSTDARENAVSVATVGLLSYLVVWPFLVLPIAAFGVLQPVSWVLMLQLLVPTMYLGNRVADCIVK